MDTKQLVHINQMLDVEALIEEIEFSKESVFGHHLRRCELVVEVSLTDTIHTTLKKYFPQIQTYIDGRLT